VARARAPTAVSLPAVVRYTLSTGNESHLPVARLRCDAATESAGPRRARPLAGAVPPRRTLYLRCRRTDRRPHWRSRSDSCGPSLVSGVACPGSVPRRGTRRGPTELAGGLL